MTQPHFPPFSAESELLRKTVADFCIKEIAPYAEKWDEEEIFPREIFTKAGELGLFGIRMPAELGGSDMDWWATTAYLESLAYSQNAGVNMALMVQSEMTLPFIARLASEEQKKLFLLPAIEGKKIAALGISEPGGGSDVSAIKCQARKIGGNGGDYVISGQKLWITNGTRADFILLAVRTGEAGHHGISFVTFPTDAKGYAVGKKLRKLGNHASDTAELFFDNCKIPARYLLGEENKGFYYIMNNFEGERLAAAIHAIALLEKILKDTINYGMTREIFGKPLIDMQVWQHRFAEHLTSCEAGRWLNYRAVDLVNRGKPALKEITMAKLFSSELAQKVTYDCMQAHGGFGYTPEYPVGRLWQDVRLYTVGAGASEVMKEIIWKQSDPRRRTKAKSQ